MQSMSSFLIEPFLRSTIGDIPSFLTPHPSSPTPVVFLPVIVSHTREVTYLSIHIDGNILVREGMDGFIDVGYFPGLR